MFSLNVIRIVAFVFALWQLEICLLFKYLGWTTDVFFVKVPVWLAVSFWSFVLLGLFVWVVVENGDG